MAEAGFEVDVLVNRTIGLTKMKISERSTLKRFQVSNVNGTRVIRSSYVKWPKNELLNVRKWSDSTLKLFRKYQQTFGKPDLILAHSAIWAGYAASRISIETGIPYIITEHRSRFTGLTAEAKKMVEYIIKQSEVLGKEHSIVPASRLRETGWKFKDNELVGEPEKLK